MGLHWIKVPTRERKSCRERRSWSISGASAAPARAWRGTTEIRMDSHPRNGTHLSLRRGGAALVESGMNLKELFSGTEISAVRAPDGVEIRAIAYDSRKVTPGTLFFALQGEKDDGNRYVPDALKRGAVAIASEQARPSGIAEDVAWIEILPGAQRRVLATVSAKFYGQPANALQLVGVTGTNGKTTTTYLVDSILRAAGKKTGLIGTIGYRTPRASRDAINTTPESLEDRKSTRLNSS